MNMNKSNQFDPPDMDAWVNERLEAYMDNQLPSEEAQRVEEWLQKDDRWHEELALAVHIRDELRSLRYPACPPHVAQHVVQHARRDAWHSFAGRLNSFFFGTWVPYWKPILATLTLLVIASVLLFRELPRESMTSEEITQVDVEEALDDIKWTLGYVSKTGRLTGDSVEDALAPIFKDLPKE